MPTRQKLILIRTGRLRGHLLPVVFEDDVEVKALLGGASTITIPKHSSTRIRYFEAPPKGRRDMPKPGDQIEVPRVRRQPVAERLTRTTNKHGLIEWSRHGQRDTGGDRAGAGASDPGPGREPGLHLVHPPGEKDPGDQRRWPPGSIKATAQAAAAGGALNDGREGEC